MELAIVSLARRMYDAHWDTPPHPFKAAWWHLTERERSRWVAAAIVARPDLVAGIAVPPDSWLAGVLPVIELPAAAGEVG